MVLTIGNINISWAFLSLPTTFLSLYDHSQNTHARRLGRCDTNDTPMSALRPLLCSSRDELDHDEGWFADRRITGRQRTRP
jgi:hypothetical protein